MVAARSSRNSPSARCWIDASSFARWALRWLWLVSRPAAARPERDRSLRSCARGSGGWASAVLCDSLDSQRLRTGSAGREPHGASDQNRGQRASSRQPGRHRHLRSSGGSAAVGPGPLANRPAPRRRLYLGRFRRRAIGSDCTLSKRNGGAGLRMLTGGVTSPTLSAQLDALLEKLPAARWHLHEPLGYENARAGTRMAFGSPLSTRVHLDRARVIVSLDDDFLCDAAAGVRHARDFSATRAPEQHGGEMSRLYVVESTPSMTGAVADHRLPLESTRIEAFARALAQRLGVLEGQTDSPNESRGWMQSSVIYRPIAGVHSSRSVAPNPRGCTPLRMR